MRVMVLRWGVGIAAGVVSALLVGGCGKPAPKVGAARIQSIYPYPINKNAPKLSWSTTLEEGMERARREGKPLMVYFGTEWCLNCQSYTKYLFSDADFVKSAEGFVPVMIDVDRDEQLADRYAVKGIPDVLFMDAEGEVLHRVVGYKSMKLVDEFPKALGLYEKTRQARERSASLQRDAPSAG